ncbi:MAG: TonB-dependent receptor plug domain-containing protein [Candidatus Aminicenantes bacterium]|nr:TonB-dependent receptor plug domain-containing protein [Candidatus Aminicenantes bacterium]
MSSDSHPSSSTPGPTAAATDDTSTPPSPIQQQQQQSKEQKDKDQKAKAAREQQAEEEKKSQKLFQLEPVYIEVVDRVRENERPNMTVVQTDLFPLTISHTLDTALERQPGIDIQRIQMIGTALDDDSVKIRGLGARRLLLLRDGRLLNSSGVAGGYFIDWTTVPPDSHRSHRSGQRPG